VVVEVLVLNRALVTRILIPLALMGTAAALAAWSLSRGGPAGTKSTPAGAVPLRNPFSLTEASKFGAFFVAVLLVVKIVQIRFPGKGLYMVAALAGLTDVDAITLSMAEYARNGDRHVAANAIVLATLTNTMVKCAIVSLLGSAALSRPVLVATGTIVAVGVIAIAVL
jgi:uncharacterized membrane protein (DUF4010 family)